MCFECLNEFCVYFKLLIHPNRALLATLLSTIRINSCVFCSDN
jgi:hypothetical protein